MNQQDRDSLARPEVEGIKTICLARTGDWNYAALRRFSHPKLPTETGRLCENSCPWNVSEGLRLLQADGGGGEGPMPTAKPGASKRNGGDAVGKSPAATSTASKTQGKRFRVALSFPGDCRELVAQVAEVLAGHLEQRRILYDKYHEAEFARVDLDTHLQRLYHHDSDLIAVSYARLRKEGLVRVGMASSSVT